MQHIIPLLIGVFIFGVLVFVHELGHFLAARRCGILVEEFAFGMGPKLFGYKPGETLYSVRIFPLGGFCSMQGLDEDSDHERAFATKTISQRMLVILAGSAMNLALALVIFAMGSLTSGFATPTVGAVMAGGSAEMAGLLPGDRLTRIDGNNINIYEDVLISITTSQSEVIRVEFTRDGVAHQLDIPTQENNGRRIIGITPQIRLGAFQSERE
ncbi:MAG: site-2 protease family protein, partial [Defluviitaleaceae bacterium]|nr:site-2 protease family protein [Defluviitaleaceae bacterium]